MYVGMVPLDGVRDEVAAMHAGPAQGIRWEDFCLRLPALRAGGRGARHARLVSRPRDGRAGAFRAGWCGVDACGINLNSDSDR